MSRRAQVSTLILGAALALAIGFGIRAWRKHRPAAARTGTRQALPLAANRLPSGLSRLSRFSDAGRPAKAGDFEERASIWAGSGCCGGSDIFSAALAVVASRANTSELARVLAVPVSELRAALACGRELAKTSGAKSTSYSLGFDVASADGGVGSYSVSIDELALEHLPETSSLVKSIDLPPSLEQGRSSVGPHAESCARVRGTRIWVQGDLDHVRAFGEALRSGAEPPGDAARFEWFANELLGYATVHLYRDPKVFNDALLHELWTEPFPSLMKEARERDEAFKFGFWVGAILKGKGPSDTELAAQIVATDEAQAEKLEQAMKKAIETRAARLRGQIPRMLEHGSEAREFLDLSARERAVTRQAWQKIKVSRDKTRIWLRTDFDLSEAEQAAKKSYESFLETKRLIAARLVNALAEGRPPERSDLEALGGSELVADLDQGFRPDLDGGAPAEPTELAGNIRFELPKPLEGDFYTPVDFERFGWKVEHLDATQSLVCGFDPAHCICFEPLPCEARGNCPSFDENIAVFEKALKPGQERQVSCERAETGRAGKLRYFEFEGDTYRDEMRWFDAAGRLVAQRNLTDYPEYCAGKTSGRWMGRIPAADAMLRERLICGRARQTLLPPLEDFRNLLGTGLELGS